jgi:hypothetical protein
MGRKKPHIHYIYKTTCNITKKYYIGMHSTNDLNDGYVGSGKRLWYSIKKYGLENFKCEILEFSPDRSSLKKREKDIVNEDTLNDHMCMNLKLGGEGGFSNEEHKKKFHSSGGRTVRLFFHKLHNDKMKNDIEYRNKVIDKLKGNKSFSGKKHKEESKKKIGESNSIKQMGEKNSQFGTCWITNGKENKKIKKETTIPIGWFLGRKK